MAFGPVDFDVTDPRYTGLGAVKTRLGIPASDTSRDAQITEAIVTAEVQIDAHLGRSFPDVAPDPVITGVPRAVITTATAVAVAVYQSTFAPFGSVGSDDLLGVVSVPEIVRAEVQRNPALVGLKVEWGIA